MTFSVTAGLGTMRSPSGTSQQSAQLAVATNASGGAAAYFAPTSDAGTTVEVAAVPDPALKLAPVKFSGQVSP